MCSTGRPSARFDSLDVTAPSDAPHLVLFRLFFFGPCVSSSFVTRTPFNVVDVDKRIRGRRKPISLFWSSSSTQRHRDRGGYLLSFQLFCLDPRSFSVLQCLRWWPLRDNIIHWGQKEKKKTLVNWESLRNITGKNSLSSLKKCLPKAEELGGTLACALSLPAEVSRYIIKPWQISTLKKKPPLSPAINGLALSNCPNSKRNPKKTVKYAFQLGELSRPRKTFVIRCSWQEIVREKTVATDFFTSSLCLEKSSVRNIFFPFSTSSPFDDDVVFFE